MSANYFQIVQEKTTYTYMGENDRNVIKCFTFCEIWVERYKGVLCIILAALL